MHTNDNLKKLIEVYKDCYSDNSDGFMERARFSFGDYEVSVVPEFFHKGVNNLEYAILYKDEMIYLTNEDDSVGRYKSYDEIVEIIENVKNTVKGDMIG